jgi:hypothetical protein
LFFFLKNEEIEENLESNNILDFFLQLSKRKKENNLSLIYFFLEILY